MRDPFDYFGVVIGLALGIAFAVFFYRVGEADYDRGYLTALASIGITSIASFGFDSGAWGVVLGQILLFGGLWIFNLRRSPR